MTGDLTTLLPSIGELPLSRSTATDSPAPAVGLDVLCRVLTALEAWGTAACAACASEPVARPDKPRGTIEGRFCDGCIADCLADTSRRHWCAIDELGSRET